MKVHELARELGLTSKELIDRLEALKVSVRNHMSVLDDDTVARVRRAIAASGTGPAGASASSPEPARGPARVVADDKVRQSDFLREKYGSDVKGVRVFRAPRPEPAAPPAAPEPAQPAAAGTTARPAAGKPAETAGRGPAARPAAAGGTAVKRPAEGKPDAKRPAAPSRERPAAHAPAAAQAASPAAPAKEKTIRFGDLRKTPRYEPGTAGAVPRPALEPLPAALEPARPVERAKPVEAPPPPQPQAPAEPAAPQPVRYLELDGPIQVGELATRMGVGPGEVVKKLVENGVLAGVNHMIPLEVATKVMAAFNYAPQARVVEQVQEVAPTLDTAETTPQEKGTTPRPPIVTVMGHVDHGKTSLLDAVRKTSVAAREFGGITQHIGAYTAEVNGKKIAFIDTPGHEAFTALRARGAQVTDIAVLVAAADDGVMPQTIEAINHAKAARVPIVVAINKIDIPQANPDRVKQQLSDLGLVPEDWGGDTIMVPVSARQGTGIDTLLEMILLVAELRDLRATPEKPARATVVEARLDKGRGPVATILVQDGTLHVGDAVVVGETYGRVRAMQSEAGVRTDTAGPSTPVEVIGLSDVPQAGDLLEAVSNERIAKAVAEERRERRRAAEQARSRQLSVEEISRETGTITERRELRLIVKGDVQGSVEALVPAIERLTTPEVLITILHAAVGNISESDVMLAAASQAVIIGFNVRPEPQTRKLAEQEHVDVRLYRVIYEVLDDLKTLTTGMLAPKMVEVVLGRVEVRRVYSISRVGTIAGSYVTSGRITRGAKVRVIRDGAVVHEGVVGSLRRFKEDVREVVEGFECGVGLERFNDIKEGDVLEVFAMETAPA
ncbi:MAG TPA: translation initiation factor IF-2 [bacterium]|nr:translation initiation factor IF-2 [bacterium]